MHGAATQSDLLALRAEISTEMAEMKVALSRVAGGNIKSRPANTGLAQRAREIYASTQAVSIGADGAATERSASRSRTVSTATQQPPQADI